MGLDDIPIRDPDARRLLERDAEALKDALPTGFRVERAQLRLEVALRNGVGEREALRLQQLGELRPPRARLRRALTRLWASTQTRLAVGAIAAATAGTLVWVAASSEPEASTRTLAAEGQTHRYQLEDGSSIELKANARGQLSLDDQTVHFELSSGLVEFDVVPGTGRLWRVTADDYEVRVVGTHFTVSYEPTAGFEVRVARGAVDVRVPEQETPFRLAAGARLEATRGEVTMTHDQASVQSEAVHLEPAEAEDRVVKTPSDLALDTLSEPSESRDDAEGEGSRVAEGPGGARGKTTADPKTPPAEARELALLRRARKAIAAQDHGGALSWIGTHQRRFPNGQLAEEREALRVEALRGLGREREARKAAGEFRQRFPKSVLSPQMPTDEE